MKTISMLTLAVAFLAGACERREERPAEREPGVTAPTTPTEPGAPAEERRPVAGREEAEKILVYKDMEGRTQNITDKDLLMQVEQKLSEQGVNPGTVDGTIDDQSMTALTELQRKKGLEESGQLDRATINALGLDASRFEQKPAEKPGMKHPAMERPGAQQPGTQPMR